MTPLEERFEFFSNPCENEFNHRSTNTGESVKYMEYRERFIMMLQDRLMSNMDDSKHTRFETGLSENYLPHWGVIEGIREFVQNAVFAHLFLDNELDLTPHEDDTVSIGNTPDGITRGKLLIGESEQRDIDSAPGEFGEGLKCGMLVLLRNNREIVFHTNGFTVVPKLESSLLDPEVRVLVFHIYETDRTEGTRVDIQCTPEELEQAKDYFIVLRGVPHEVATKNSILTDLPGVLSVNGVKVTERKAVLGYNFTNAKLANRDRSALDDSILTEEVKSILGRINEVSVAERVLSGIRDNETLEATTGIYGYLSNDEVWGKASSNVFGDKCVLATGKESDGTARYKGHTLITDIPRQWWYFFEDILHIPSAERLQTLAEKHELVHAKPKGTPAQNLGWAKRLITLYYGDYGTIKISNNLVDEYGNRCAGMYDKVADIIWLDESILDNKKDTFTTLLHEAIHKLTGTLDNTPGFTQAWEDATWAILNRGKVN